MTAKHNYTTQVIWTGNRGEGTSHYRSYDRTWKIDSPGKPIIHCSNDPLLGGDPTRPNPEDLLIASLSACHMLWYLHLASNAGIIVEGYADNPIAVGKTEASGAGRFIKATLKPHITLSQGTNLEEADSIHREIHKFCFIAQSVNFPVDYQASYTEIT